MTREQQIQLVAIAKNLLGKPYRYGATPVEAPNIFDCSSFTQHVFKQIGIELPRSSILQAADSQGKEVTLENLSSFEIGDLLFMRGVVGRYNNELFPHRELYIGHVALYIGNDEVIHARQKGVVIERIKDVAREPKYAISYVKRF